MDIKRTNKKTTQIKPFLKWVGGKRQLINELEKYFPEKIENYFEPFMGAGAVAMHLINNKRVNKKIHMNDKNLELVITYQQVIQNTNKLISLLEEHKERNTKEHFLALRAKDREIEWIDTFKDNHSFVAARMIYMNKVCFNGLYRLNSSGQFNAPYGRYKNPNIVDKENLTNISKSMVKVKFHNKDFDFVESKAKKGDLVYFDPPYIPETATASFVAYTKDGFGLSDQMRLMEIAKKLTKKGVHVVISNSDTELTRKIYSDQDNFEIFEINTVEARRSINRNGNKRKGSEVIIVNKV